MHNKRTALGSTIFRMRSVWNHFIDVFFKHDWCQILVIIDLFATKFNLLSSFSSLN